jgi:hypothetical protein
MTCTVVADVPRQEANPAQLTSELADRAWAWLTDLIHVSFAPSQG